MTSTYTAQSNPFLGIDTNMTRCEECGWVREVGANCEGCAERKALAAMTEVTTSTITAAHYIAPRFAFDDIIEELPGGEADDAELESINYDADVTFVEQVVGYGDYTHVACIGTDTNSHVEQRYAIVAIA